MSLLLDKTLVRGHNLKLSATLNIETGDASGQTSSTAKTHQGFKAKKFSVALAIRYEDEAYLITLRELAEAVVKGGKRKVYLITNVTAQVFGVKQVEFTEMFSIREDDNLNQWQVQFNLVEHLSNPERTESRQATKEVDKPNLPGEPINEAEEQEQLTWGEGVLKRWDDWLGGEKPH